MYRASPVLFHRRTSFLPRQSLFMDICREAGLRPFVLNAARTVPQAPADTENNWRGFGHANRRWPQRQHPHAHQENLERLENLSAWLELVEAPVAIESALGSAAEKFGGAAGPPGADINGRARAFVPTEVLGSVAPAMNGASNPACWSSTFSQTSPLFGFPARPRAEETLTGSHGDPAALAAATLSRALAALAGKPGTASKPAPPGPTWSCPPRKRRRCAGSKFTVRQKGVVNKRWGFGGPLYARARAERPVFRQQRDRKNNGGGSSGRRTCSGPFARIDLSCVVTKIIGET